VILLPAVLYSLTWGQIVDTCSSLMIEYCRIFAYRMEVLI
jgi:hypothetical protein